MNGGTWPHAAPVASLPVASEGRLIGALLMTAGVGLFGTVSGFVAAWFLAPKAAQNRSGIEANRVEIVALRGEIAALREAIEKQDRPQP